MDSSKALEIQPSAGHARAGQASARPSSDQPTPKRRRAYGDVIVLVVLLTLVFAAWRVTQQGWFKPGDDVGYWLGVAGGSMMLLLLIYPLRKRIRAMRGWGDTKVWLWGHMMLGIGGPLLILLHCNFQASSLNAAAALYSMVIVASSGVIGRFLYVRVNRGLTSERLALEALRKQIGAEGSSSLIKRLPEIQKRLIAFETSALKAANRTGLNWVRLVLVLPTRSWISRITTQLQARKALADYGQARGWDAEALRRRQSRMRHDIVSYYIGVMRVAMFAAWERLFALWHVAHVPFVFLLLIAGVVHVVAVHAY